MLGVNGGRPMWSRLLNSDAPHSPSGQSDHVDNGINSTAEAGYAGMESLDYEVVESLAYREDQARTSTSLNS